MLKNGQRLKVSIAYVDVEGYGIASVGRDTIFLSNVIQGEKVEVEIVKRLKEGYSGKVIRLLEASADRCDAPCPLFNKCGSCHLQHMHTAAQNRWKHDAVARMVKESKLNIKVADILYAENPYGYRNKIIIGFTKDKQGIHAGFYEEYSHHIVPMDKCLLHDDECNELIQGIVNQIRKLRIEPYQEDRRRGILRHVLIRKGMVSKEIMIVLVTSQPTFPARGQLVDALRKMNPKVKTIIQNVNQRNTSIVLGKDEKVLYGPGFIEDELCGNTYRISATSFYQINHDQTEVLYHKALDLLEVKGNETVLDTYCGIGTIGMTIASKVKQVTGVELNKQAVGDAIQNAKRNRIQNIRFVGEDATVYMQKLAGNRGHLDILIMDPPRSGSTPEFINAAGRLRPKSILYISCNPKTQIRDLKLFEKVGYQTDTMYLVDLFPQTNHVESIVKLERKK